MCCDAGLEGRSVNKRDCLLDNGIDGLLIKILLCILN